MIPGVDCLANTMLFLHKMFGIPYRIPCRPCMCPGGPTSDIQHADSCYEDPRLQTVVCNCNPGFKGEKMNISKLLSEYQCFLVFLGGLFH